MPEWSADIEVTDGLVRDLIAGQFPELAGTSTSFLAEGWDNSVWLVDGRYVFRFPRRRIATPGIERELDVLPGIAACTPSCVPLPVFVGRPSDLFPWPFYGAELIVGRELPDADLADDERGELVSSLAAFLRALHSRRTAQEVATDLPIDPMGRADMTERVGRARTALNELVVRRLWDAPAPVHSFLDESEGLGPTQADASVLHGDLHLRHVLVAADGGLAGVIDWGDVCRGDPAIDLSIAWSAFSASGRADFFGGYGVINEEQQVRARVLAMYLCAVLAAYGHDEANEPLTREALAGLTRAIDDL